MVQNTIYSMLETPLVLVAPDLMFEVKLSSTLRNDVLCVTNGADPGLY
jgi:hypothetical protein